MKLIERKIRFYGPDEKGKLVALGNPSTMTFKPDNKTPWQAWAFRRATPAQQIATKIQVLRERVI